MSATASTTMPASARRAVRDSAGSAPSGAPDPRTCAPAGMCRVPMPAAEHPVRPALVDQHGRSAETGDPAHHVERVVPGRGAVHRQRIRGVHSGRQHVRVERAEQRDHRRRSAWRRARRTPGPRGRRSNRSQPTSAGQRRPRRAAATSSRAPRSPAPPAAARPSAPARPARSAVRTGAPAPGSHPRSSARGTRRRAPARNRRTASRAEQHRRAANAATASRPGRRPRPAAGPAAVVASTVPTPSVGHPGAGDDHAVPGAAPAVASTLPRYSNATPRPIRPTSTRSAAAGRRR